MVVHNHSMSIGVCRKLLDNIFQFVADEVSKTPRGGNKHLHIHL